MIEEDRKELRTAAKAQPVNLPIGRHYGSHAPLRRPRSDRLPQQLASQVFFIDLSRPAAAPIHFPHKPAQRQRSRLRYAPVIPIAVAAMPDQWGRRGGVIDPD